MTMDPRAAVREAEKIADRGPESLREFAYREIKNGIIQRRWRPGTPLSEQTLAVELGMSRTPVREAFRALARDGLIQSFPGRGTFVVELSPIELRELYEFREVLEGQAARLAAQRATGDEVDDLLALDREGAASSSVDEMVRLGAEFHELVATLARSRRICEALRGLEHLTGAARVLGYRLLPGVWSEHSRIAEAIAARDADEAEKIARAHIRAAMERLFAL